MSSKKVTRKELAAEITRMRGDLVTTYQVMVHEAEWGLKPARGKDLNRRTVRYDFDKALAALRAAEVVPAG
jgi:hypothetical protein